MNRGVREPARKPALRLGVSWISRIHRYFVGIEPIRPAPAATQANGLDAAPDRSSHLSLRAFETAA
ncbi:hypothetical protein LC55x_2804 [Lysobacter capsici]|nr:hypothetical protein LC55x_2804 [Lysobacter capsici]